MDAALIAIEEGSVALTDEVADNGATLRHLLAHAGGFPFDDTQPVSAPGQRRIYSNTGYELLANHIASATGIEFDEYLDESLVQPLGANSVELLGSPAKDIHASASDVAKLAIEMQRPTLLSNSTVVSAITPHFPDLEGIVPSVGKFSPCQWGLGPEIKGHKHPHWTGTRNSASTFGHFGGTGTFLWVDPVTNAACVLLSDKAFSDWGMIFWPAFSDSVLEEVSTLS